jgi:ribosomal protein S6
MALYEHLLIARQDISAQQVDALATHLKTIVEGEAARSRSGNIGACAAWPIASRKTARAIMSC